MRSSSALRDHRRIVPILAAMGVLALLASSTRTQEDDGGCIVLDEHTKRILIQALEKALQEHVGTLFHNRLKEPRSGPERHISGMTNAITAYQNAIAALEEKCEEVPP